MTIFPSQTVGHVDSILFCNLSIPAGLPVAFVAFSIYEKHEQAIDSKIFDAVSFGCKLKSNISKKVLGAKKND